MEVKPQGITTALNGRAVGSFAVVALSALDKLNRGVVLIDRDRVVCFVNRSGRAMLKRRRGFSVRSGHLEFHSPEHDLRLRNYLAEEGPYDDAASLVLRIDGASRNRPYRVLVSPLPDSSPDATAAFHCVFIYEPHGGRVPLPIGVLQQLYGLTRCEAELVNTLFCGYSLSQAAAELSISINTAKSALKRSFAKCQVRSQAELLQLLALGPRTL